MAFREANLVRHHYVGCALINFTNASGDWTAPRVNWPSIGLQDNRRLNSPRFIHLDEFSQAEFLTKLGGDSKAKFANRFFEEQLVAKEEEDE